MVTMVTRAALLPRTRDRIDRHSLSERPQRANVVADCIESFLFVARERSTLAPKNLGAIRCPEGREEEEEEAEAAEAEEEEAAEVGTAAAEGTEEDRSRPTNALVNHHYVLLCILFLSGWDPHSRSLYFKQTETVIVTNHIHHYKGVPIFGPIFHLSPPSLFYIITRPAHWCRGPRRPPWPVWRGVASRERSPTPAGDDASAPAPTGRAPPSPWRE